MNSEFIDINLLPRPVKPASETLARLRRMAPGLLLLVLAVMLVIAGYLLMLNNSQQLAKQEEQIDTTRQRILQFSAVMAEVEILQQQINTLATQAEQLEGDAKRLEEQNSSLAGVMAAITNALLPRMSLSGFVASDMSHNLLVVQGEAGSRSLVLSYISSLKEQPEIESVHIRSIEQLKGDAPPSAVRWILEVK